MWTPLQISVRRRDIGDGRTGRPKCFSMALARPVGLPVAARFLRPARPLSTGVRASAFSRAEVRLEVFLQLLHFSFRQLHRREESLVLPRLGHSDDADPPSLAGVREAAHACAGDVVMVDDEIRHRLHKCELLARQNIFSKSCRSGMGQATEKEYAGLVDVIGKRTIAKPSHGRLCARDKRWVIRGQLASELAQQRERPQRRLRP